MRGVKSYSEGLFTMGKLENLVPASRPLRPIRALVNDTLAKMDAKFSAIQVVWRSQENEPVDVVMPGDEPFCGVAMFRTTHCKM